MRAVLEAMPNKPKRAKGLKNRCIRQLDELLALLAAFDEWDKDEDMLLSEQEVRSIPPARVATKSGAALSSVFDSAATSRPGFWDFADFFGAAVLVPGEGIPPLCEPEPEPQQVSEGASRSVAEAAAAEAAETLLRQRLVLATADPVDAMWRQYASGDRMDRAGYTRYVMEVCNFDGLDDAEWRNQMASIRGSAATGVDRAGFQLLYTVHGRDAIRDQAKVLDTAALQSLVEEAKRFASGETTALRAIVEAKLALVVEQRVVWDASVPELISMMRARSYTEDREAVANCAYVLRSLAASQEHRAAIVAAGGIDALTAAMRAHPAAEQLQQNCATALGNLALSQEHRAAIAAAGGIDLLTAAMRAHPAAELLQQGCGGALAVLAWSEEHHAAIAAAGGIGVLTAAMRAHPAAEGVQQNCGLALSRLEQ
jgi:hypothetical protein